MPYYNIDNGRYYTDSSCTTECDSKGNVVGEKLISAILAPIVLLIFLSYFFVPLFRYSSFIFSAIFQYIDTESFIFHP